MLGFVVIAVGISLLIAGLWRRAQKRAAERLVQDWMEAFPGRCMPCSYARASAMMGGPDKPPAPHPCPEGNSQPWPLPVARVHR